MIELFDYQASDVRNLLAHGGTGFVVSETGAGKTVVAAKTAQLLGAPTKLIIAPQGTHEKVWRKTILAEGIDPGARVMRIDGSAPGKAAFDALEWKTPGYYMVTPQLFTRWASGFQATRPDMTIVDEAHLLGNREAVGAAALSKLQTGAKMPMSGTMWRNKFENAWSLLRWVYGDQFSGHGEIADVAYRRWEKTFCETEYDHFAVGNIKVVGELIPGQIASLVPCWVQHFKREECCEFHPEGFLKDLPAPIHIVETVELTTTQRRAITQMEEEYVAWLEVEQTEAQRVAAEIEQNQKIQEEEAAALLDAGLRDEARPHATAAKKLKSEAFQAKKKALIVKLPLVRMTRLRQMALGMPSFHDTGRFDDRGFPIREIYFAPECESPKLDRLIELWRTKIQEPTVASMSSQKFAAETVRRLNAVGIRAFEWSGDATQKKRDEALDDFKAGKYDMIVGVTSSIGTGIDGLQDVSGVLVTVERDLDLSNETQMIGRQDRRGQIRKEGVIHYEIIASGSADEGVLGKQLAKRLSLNRSLKRDLVKKYSAQSGTTAS